MRGDVCGRRHWRRGFLGFLLAAGCSVFASKHPVADVSDADPMDLAVSLVSLMNIPDDALPDETPLEAAERQAQESWDAFSATNEKGQKLKAKAKEAKETLTDARSQQAEAEAAEERAQKAYAAEKKELAEKSGVRGAPCANDTKYARAQGGGNKATEGDEQKEIDNLDRQLATQTEDAMSSINDAESDVARKTNIMSEFVAQYAENNATLDDERRAKADDQDAAKRKKEVDEKEYQKYQEWKQQEHERREKVVHAEKTEKSNAQRTADLEQVQQHQTRIADVLDAEQARLIHENNTMFEQREYNHDQLARLAVQIMHSKADKRAADKAMSALRDRVAQIKRARRLVREVKVERQEMAVKQDLINQTANLYAHRLSEVDKEKSEIAEKREAADEHVQKKMVVAKRYELRVKKQKKHLEYVMQQQQTQFKEMETYRKNEQDVKKLEESKRTAQKKLDELIQKHGEKTEEVRKSHVVAAARRFDRFVQKEKDDHAAEIKHKFMTQQETEAAKELQEKKSLHLFDILKKENATSNATSWGDEYSMVENATESPQAARMIAKAERAKADATLDAAPKFDKDLYTDHLIR